jgi:transcriptional antiterminator
MGKYTPYVISENEIGFLVLHIGVGLERTYNIGYQRQPRVLLVCDAGNAMARMIEAVLQRKYPQIDRRYVTLRDYEQRESISEDFVISTARISEISRGDDCAVPDRLSAGANWQTGAGGQNPPVDAE